MTEEFISVSKTARYFMLGEPTDQVKNVWFVLHGYGQLANYFLKNFESIANKETLIIAPEGLSRFYLNGYSGRVGATWMTREDRENDIKDYVNFLNQLSEQVLKKVPENVKINVLGFSQGTATASRWINEGKIKADNFILWAGLFPPDVKFEVSPQFFEMGIHLVLGDEDEFFSQIDIEGQKKILQSSGVGFMVHLFMGKHIIQPQILKDLSEKL